MARRSRSLDALRGALRLLREEDEVDLMLCVEGRRGGRCWGGELSASGLDSGGKREAVSVSSS